MTILVSKHGLVKHYGDASRIVNDTIAALSKKKKPNPTSKKDRYTFYSDIVIALLRLERLTNDKLIDNVLLSSIRRGDFLSIKTVVSRLARPRACRFGIFRFGLGRWAGS